MASRDTPSEGTDLSRTEIEEVVLDAVQKGFTKVSDLVSFCGPALIDVSERERDLDVPQVMRAIHRLIQSGHLERIGGRGTDQLEVRLTDHGRETAPPLAEREQALLAAYGVPSEALNVLSEVVAYEREQGSLPTIDQLQSRGDTSLGTYQIQPLFTKLVDEGLAEARGLFRFKVDPTDEGRAAISEYADLLES